MKKRLLMVISFVLLSVILLAACGSPAATEAPIMEMPAFAEPPADFSDGQAGVGAPAEAPALSGGVDPAEEAKRENLADSGAIVLGPVDTTIAAGADRLIIKNADMRLLVADTDVAMDRMTQVVGDLGGYIISSRVWYQTWQDGENYKYATVTIGVPVDQFERMLGRFRELSVQVLDETASGEDVTDQFVDLQSQLTNLEATRDRIKTFLEQAKTVDEALRINQELSEIERQIEEIRGRMNYLSDRSAFSTVTVNFEPELPEIIPTPTATPTATPTPDPWKPGETFDNSVKSVTRAYQGIVDFLIWFLVVFVPIVAPIVLVVWIIWRVVKRMTK
jgi:hypothetical protein